MEGTKLIFYNTLTREKDVFKPIKKDQVGMYSCGPTVYAYPTIGNMRTYIFSDLLRRVLEYFGYDVKHVMNVTDVGHLVGDGDSGEDKLEKAASNEHKRASDIAKYYLNVFESDMKKLNILEPHVFPKATEHVKEQIDFIKKLERKGYTYRTDDGIYFNSAKFTRYGKFAKLNVKSLRAGQRVSMGGKKRATDFALWKFSEEVGKRQQEWKSPWGVGYPGWHIECSAMSMKYLGTRFDIHTGGEDHVPVHHTNEIAQSEALTGKRFVNYWMHGAFLTFKGEKISKSKGGLYTVSELEELGYEPIHFRYLCLLTHYHKPLDFSLEHLDAAKAAFERIKRKIIALREQSHKGPDRTEKYRKFFNNAISGDLGIPEAVRVFIGALDDEEFDAKKKYALLLDFDRVLGLDVKGMQESRIDVPADVRKLVAEREKARQERNWARADELRAVIQAKGYSVEDSADGPRVKG